MKSAHVGDVDLCDLQKVGQIKNLGIMSCTLMKMKKLGDDPGVIAPLLVFQDGCLAAIFEVRSGRNSVEM
jgi:hypothetical protein